MRVAPEIILTNAKRAELTRLVRSKLTSVRLVQRARIVLLATQGLQSKDIAVQLRVGRVQVSRVGASATHRRGLRASNATCRAGRHRPRLMWRAWWS